VEEGVGGVVVAEPKKKVVAEKKGVGEGGGRSDPLVSDQVVSPDLESVNHDCQLYVMRRVVLFM
jgi:hypothetical protein